MENDKIQTETKRGRGRPSLSPAEKEQRRVENIRKSNERHKASGYVAQKKYRETNPEKIVELRKAYYEPKVRIPISSRPLIDDLLSENNISITQLFLTAVEEKYGVILSERIDKAKK